LRAPLAPQLARADALVVVATSPGERERFQARWQPVLASKGRAVPIFYARLEADAAALAGLTTAPVLAFAGIGDPQKFYATLAQAAVTVAATRSFADHHRYTPMEAKALCDQAERGGLALVTTEKDWVRLQGEAELTDLAARARALPVTLVLEDQAALPRLAREKLALARRDRASA
jgi:tetraacyldisaccharide 4'-kinase